MRIVFISLLFVCALISCKKERLEDKTLIVADHKVDCTGAGPQRCFLIREHESQQWEFFYNAIEGFDYEEGFEYLIEVKVFKISNPPQDASDRRYVLKRIISKK
jgi:hypothetical protein